MIVGGKSSNPAWKCENKAYALSLDTSSAEVPSCLNPLCDFPHYVHAPLMAIFDGFPTVCGGRNQNDGENNYYTECYQFNFTRNSWGDPAEPLSHKKIAGIHTGKLLFSI